MRSLKEGKNKWYIEQVNLHSLEFLENVEDHTFLSLVYNEPV